MPPRPSPRRAPLAAAIMAAALVTAAPAAAQPVAAAPYVPGEVVVKYADGTSRTARAATQRTTGVGAPEPTARLERVLRIRDGESVAATVRELRARGSVEYAVPNYIARASGFIPNDPGRGAPGAWQAVQWNFAPETGINMPDAWANLIAAGRPGGRGVIVAVLDTGVAYANRGRFRRSPDLRATTFVRGYDFVDRDPYPNDHNGHGTHVASTIAEATNNGIGLTGIAYGARVMPVRVLDARGEGDAVAIARGIRFAARRGAQVINLSLEFSTSITAGQIPEIIAALSYARRKGALIVGAAGNEARRSVAYPARNSNVFSVGATTEHGCLADYSNEGPGLDIVAPGGGNDAQIADDPARCRPFEAPGRDIFQVTFDTSVRRFGISFGLQGTSMAAPHVSATAALVIASGVIGRRPSPQAIEARLKATARDLGKAGYDTSYGAGMLDAAAATAPPAPAPAPAPPPAR